MSHTIDFASIDGNRAPGKAGFLQAKQLGCIGVQLRAEYDWGTKPMEDDDWKRDHDAAQEAGLKVGAYLITNWLDGVEPEARVAMLAKIVGTLNPKINLVTAFDIEFPSGILGTNHTRVQLLALIRRYVKAIKDWQNGVWPELYFSGRVWNTDDTDTLGNPPASDLTDCSPWVAAYPGPTGHPPTFNTTGMTLGKYGAPNPWGWAFKHQYQGDARPYAGIGQCDISRVIYMRLGHSGPGIGWAQKRAAAYFKQVQSKGVILSVPPEGGANVFDDEMNARIKLVQKLEGLDQDGIIGLDTHNVLNWVPV